MDLADFLTAMKQVQSMGSLSSLMGMLPGKLKVPKGVNLDDNRMKHVEAIILSMTPRERRDPDVMNGSRVGFRPSVSSSPGSPRAAP